MTLAHSSIISVHLNVDQSETSVVIIDDWLAIAPAFANCVLRVMTYTGSYFK